MNNPLILGAKGMLGGQLKKLFPNATAWDREDIDVRDFEALKNKVFKLPETPEVMVNCVAFNDVDGAEEKRDAARLLNAELPGQLAGLCKTLDIPFVHFSSNYVFDGIRGEYEEIDLPNPLSYYGQTKYEGEQRLMAEGGKNFLIRTAVLFGPHGESDLSKKSFIDIMLERAAAGGEIKVVNDEINSLTYVVHLADAIKYLLNEGKAPGIYHITNSGQASWYDIAKELFAFLQKQVQLVPVPSVEFPRTAMRPRKAVLLNTKLYALPKWEDALREFLLARPQPL